MAAEANDRDGTAGLLAAARKAVAAGRFERAQRCCRRALDRNPRCAEALATLGLVLAEMGRLDEAERFLRQAVSLCPDSAEARNNLGVVLNRRWRGREAIEHFEAALAVCPDDAMLHCNRGIALYRSGQAEAAVEAFGRALALRLDFVEALHQRALAWAALERHDRAAADCRRALEIAPDAAEVWNSLGSALHRMECFDEARAALERAVGLDAGFAQAHYNLGNLLRNLGDCEGAIEAYDRAIALQADFADAHWNRATALLLAGRYREGWQGFGWRRKAHTVRRLYPHALAGPRWDGGAIAGRRLLVHYEQGYGDSIQFWRFLPRLRACGARVILQERAALAPLVRSDWGVDRVIGNADEPVGASEYDLHVSLLDLPGLFDAGLNDVAGAVPYVRADGDRVRRMAKRIPSSGCRVGIVWAGSARHENDRHRSCRLSWFLELARVPGVRLINLQKGPAEAELAGAEGLGVVALGPDLRDFADTAGAIASLDLVIGVDTAVVHLAGAMGRPVWTLLPFAPDWRWMLGRADSPWYPTMRLFRQPTWGDWPSVFIQVVDALRRFVAGPCGRGTAS